MRATTILEHPRLLAAGSAAAGLLSWTTLALASSSGPIAHFAQNATWGLIIGAVVLSLLAADGVASRGSRLLIGVGILAAALRAVVAFLPQST